MMTGAVGTEGGLNTHKRHEDAPTKVTNECRDKQNEMGCVDYNTN